jgi:hypothetical protein
MDFTTLFQDFVSPMGLLDYWLAVLGLLVGWYLLALGISHLAFGAGQEPVRAVQVGAISAGLVVGVSAFFLGFYALFRANLAAAAGLAVVTLLITQILVAIVGRVGVRS